jgi:hypothetical protein
MRQVELPSKGGGIVTEVGTCWTLPLTVAVLRLPFLDAAYCSPPIVSFALLSRPLSSSGLLFFPVIVLAVLLFRLFLLFSRFGSTIACTSISRSLSW